MRMRIAAAFVLGLMVLSLPVGAMATTEMHQENTAKKEGDVAAHQHDVVQGPHVEGHIAFLHAELGITQNQEALWAPVADAMRKDVQTLDEAQDRVAGDTHGRLTAIQYLHNRAMFAQLRAEGEARFLHALQPLYDSLSSTQKRMADELLIPAGPDDRERP